MIRIEITRSGESVRLFSKVMAEKESDVKNQVICTCGRNITERLKHAFSDVVLKESIYARILYKTTFRIIGNTCIFKNIL